MTRERISERCTRRGRRKQCPRWPNLYKSKRFKKKKKCHHHHHVKLYLQRCLLYILLSSSTTPSRSPTITTISLPRLVMISGGEKVGEFLFNLIFNLARIERAAMMMMMMMSAVVRIFSIRETAAALVFVSKIFHKNGQLVSFIFSPGRWGVSKTLRGGMGMCVRCMAMMKQDLSKKKTMEDGNKYRSCLFSNALAATAPATAPPKVANFPPPNTSLANAPPPAAPTSVAPISFPL